MKNQGYDDLLQEAQKYWHAGYDNEYIHGQLSESGVDEDNIKKVLKEIDSIRKSEKRRQGVKFILGGIATVTVAFVFTWFSFANNSPIVYVLYGLIVTGCMSFAKGLADMI